MHPPCSLLAAGDFSVRLAVVSPFLDRSHGTERCIVEQIERWAKLPGVEFHLYAQEVKDLPGVVRFRGQASPGLILWHKVPKIPGPHLFGFAFWFVANHVQRFWDAHVRGLQFDAVYTPGINISDADVISVHIVFQEFYRRVRSHLRFRDFPVVAWPILIHRLIYYRLICFLERVIYSQRRTALCTISRYTAEALAEFAKRDDIVVIRYGVDAETFDPRVRLARREGMRASLGMSSERFCLLLIGNDWKKKGLDALLQALALCRNLPLELLVVGKDDRRGYDELLGRLGLAERVRFVEPSPDVVQFFAAADAYVGPSLEDAYGLPILEAMACGLPVIASARAGASEIIADGKDGLILRNPEDSRELAEHLQRLASDTNLCARLGEAAAATAREHTWDRNAAETWEFLQKAAERKKSTGQRKAGA